MRAAGWMAVLMFGLANAALAQNEARPLPPATASRLLGATLAQARADFPSPPLAIDGDPEAALAYGDQDGPLLLAMADRALTADTLAAVGEKPTPVALVALRDMTPVDASGPVPLTRLAHVIPGGPMRVVVLYLGVRLKGQRRVLEVYSRDATPLLAVPLAAVEVAEQPPLVRLGPAEGRAGRRSLQIFLPGGEGADLPLAPLADRFRLPRPREGSLKTGDRAPDFKLRSPNEKLEVQLSQFAANRPVALIFGSYT